MSHIQANLSSGRQCRGAKTAVSCALLVLLLGVVVVGQVSDRHPESKSISVATADASGKQAGQSDVNDFFGEVDSVSTKAGLSGQFVNNVFSDGDAKSSRNWSGLDDLTFKAKTVQLAWKEIENPDAAPVFNAVKVSQVVSNENANSTRTSVEQASGVRLPSLPDSFLPPDNTDIARRSVSNDSHDHSSGEFFPQSDLSRLENVFTTSGETQAEYDRRVQQMNRDRVSQISPTSFNVKPGWAADAAARTKQLDRETREFLGEVAVTVYGTSITHRDFLRRYVVYLRTMRDYMVKSSYQRVWSDEPTPDDVKRVDEVFERSRSEYRKLLQQLVQRDLEVVIQRKVLCEHLRQNVTADQWARAEAWIDEQFPRQVDRLMREMNVVTQSELKQALGDLDIDLQQVRSDFACERLSQDCIEIFCKKAVVLMPEIEEYYASHRDKFEVASIADWQQICAPCSSRKQQAAARAKLEVVLSELASGRLFGDDALIPPVSENSQLFRSTNLQVRLEDIKDVELRKQVATAALDRWTPVFSCSEMLCAIRVSHRDETHIKPLEEVQDEIRVVLYEVKSREIMKTFCNDIYSKAKIETAYQLPDEMTSPNQER